MKIFYSEHRSDYSHYTFSYAVYALMEDRSELDQLYASGFLPYSGDINLHNEIFYLTRSLRIDLDAFADTSENRRLARKLDALAISVNAHAKSDFDTAQPDFVKFCTEFALERFKGGSMSADRLQYILGRQPCSHILEFRTGDDRLAGYVLACVAEESMQYWFCFYDTGLLEKFPLGKWMMWRTMHWAKEQGLKYCHLGTCYKPGGLYKARDFKGVSFFDGTGWNNNIKILKQLCQRDEEDPGSLPDLFKQNSGELAAIHAGFRTSGPAI